MKIPKLTKSAWLLLSGLLSPVVVTIGAYTCDHGHPYVGGTVTGYGILWFFSSVIGGIVGVIENGFGDE